MFKYKCLNPIAKIGLNNFNGNSVEMVFSLDI